MRSQAKAATAGSTMRRAGARRSLRALAPTLAALLLLALAGASPVQALPGDYLESFGPDGTAGTEFERPAGLAVDEETGAVYVADSQTQTLYKFDEEGNPLDWGGSAPYISENRITGLALNNGNPGTAEVAIDQETHVVYVTSANKVRAFEANGEPHNFTAGPGEGTSEIPGATELYGVAVDRFGTIYASDFGDKKVRIYSSAGAPITEFKPLLDQGRIVRPGTLAVAPDGTLYITDFAFPVAAFEPSKFPVTAKTTYGIGQRVNGKFSASVTVDPTTQYVYIGEVCSLSETCDARVVVYDDEGGFLGPIGAEGPGELEGLPAGLGANGGTKKLYAAVRGDAGDLSQVAVFETFQFPVLAPTLSGVQATDVTTTAATLRARINPHTLETTYRFQYGIADCAAEPLACTEVPLGGASAGSGHKPVPVSVDLTGLTPGTTYHYRLLAVNAKGPVASPQRILRTQTSAFGFEAMDGRVWEQVTPVEKFGGSIVSAGVVQAAPDGEGITFPTRGSIVAAPEGNRAPEFSAALARRGGAGWGAEDLTPPHTEATGLGFGPGEFKAFSPDLGHAVFEARDDTPLSEEASERTPYLRTNTTPPLYRPLVTAKEGFANVPLGTVFGGAANGGRNPVSIAAVNDALTHVVVSSEVPLEEGAENRALYLWHEGALEPVSMLPGEGGGVVKAQPGSGTITVRHAISEDGSRVFWAPGDPSAPSLDWPALYLRDTVADETTRLDVVQSGLGAGEAHPAFMGASADGSVVFFTDSQQLTEDASPAGRDLYRCQIGDTGGGSLGCTDIEDLSVPLGAAESAAVRELALGIGEDGGSVYFVADAILDAQPNEIGESAVSGSPNLYLWQQGEGVRFIAPLSGGDEPNWGRPARKAVVADGAYVAASVSPNGRYLAFMSERSLTDVETGDPETGEPVEHAYRYDAVTDSLACLSCNPSGATDGGYRLERTAEGGAVYPDPMGLWFRDLVGATLPEAYELEPANGFTFHRPRAVLDNGRVFFNSPLSLVPADSNGVWDVYQYEPFGVGGCDAKAERPSIAVKDGACLGLVSSGTDDKWSVFMDASQSGDDAFLATFAPLSVLDSDADADVYDARVDGVAAVAEQHPECLGEACQPGVAAPNDPTPATAALNGPGNPKAATARCRKGQRKVRSKGKVRCVKRARKHASKSKGARR